MSQRSVSAGARLRAAVEVERPLQVVGTINAYAALLAQQTGFRAIYLSGAGVANASFGLPDLGITSLNDVCEDVRHISAACPLPLLVDADTRSEEHTSELQSPCNLVCRLLLEKKKGD